MSEEKNYLFILIYWKNLGIVSLLIHIHLCKLVQIPFATTIQKDFNLVRIGNADRCESEPLLKISYGQRVSQKGSKSTGSSRTPEVKVDDNN